MSVNSLKPRVQLAKPGVRVQLIVYAERAKDNVQDDAYREDALLKSPSSVTTCSQCVCCEPQRAMVPVVFAAMLLDFPSRILRQHVR